MTMVKLQVTVQGPPDPDDTRGHNRPRVFDLEVEINPTLADEVCALVLCHLAKRNANAVSRDG